VPEVPALETIPLCAEFADTPREVAKVGQRIVARAIKPRLQASTVGVTYPTEHALSVRGVGP